ncbi:MAG: HetZ-related protein 2 [Leptolyngbya sp. SIO1E4]|nr:HetZ-related protein 2 [Leptolyngbya sp. SIO1E4]
MTADAITQAWTTKLTAELPKESEDVRQSILQWLMGPNPERFDTASSAERTVLTQALDYRYQILQQRYWAVGPDIAYQRLIKRLSSLFLVRSKVRTWIALSRDRRRTVTDVLQEVIQEMLRSDRYLNQQIAWIAECTRRTQMRNLLMLATIEEYCLRPIRNQPLLVYRFVNYLRRSQRGGMTHIPTGELVRLVSDEIATDDPDASMSLLDLEAVAQYESREQAEEEQTLRQQVKQKFADYLTDTLDTTASQWLELHLQGFTQEAIAQQLNLSTKEAYRLREKIRYHAIRVFTLKEQPDLVLNWLKTSLKEHNLGLLPEQWEQFCADCNPLQQKILQALKSGNTFEDIAQASNLKLRQVTGEWAQLYLHAQTLRQGADDS